MERYKRLYEEDIKTKSFNWLSKFLLTSKTEFPSNDIIRFFQNFPNNVHKIYRGIGLIYSRIAKENIVEINNLQIGDQLPLYITRPTGISSYTKRLPLAKIYSEGKKSIVVEATPSNNKILLDLEVFAKYLRKKGETFFDKEDLDYMTRDKEVIILEPIKSYIVYMKGKI